MTWLLRHQANCHWCTTPIYTYDMDDIDFWYNPYEFSGHPICKECLDGLTIKRPTKNRLRKILGLDPLKPERKEALDKWL